MLSGKDWTVDSHGLPDSPPSKSDDLQLGRNGMKKLLTARGGVRPAEDKMRLNQRPKNYRIGENRGYREKLLAKERELLSDLERTGIRCREQPERGGLDAADESIFLQTTEIVFAQAQRHTELLSQVREALDRISEGTYGRCLTDGEMIPKARLEAVPWTLYCVKHQEMLDGISENPR